MTKDYNYSPVGNITEKVTEHGSYTYQYDDLQRLTEAVNPLSEDETYTYGLLGNRLTADSVPGTWSYNANNELLGYDNVSFNYDDNGNTIRETVGVQETNYIYDVEDRLVQVENETGSVIAKYYYDPLGRRLWKDVDSVRTYYLYSDEGLIGEYDQSGAEIRAYGYAPNSVWTTDPLFVKSGNSYYWYQNDHAGTPQKIIDTSGRVVWSAVYDSFGNIQIETAEIINNLRFAGQYFDSETGLYYNLNRYYDPITGRYLRTDPFGEGLNLYAYVFNNPVNLIDPLGLCAAKDTFDTGLKQYELFKEDIHRQPTGYAKIVVKYESVAGSDEISGILELLGVLLKGSSMPYGHLKRSVYIHPEYAIYNVQTITDTRTGHQREYRQMIPRTRYTSPINSSQPVYEDVVFWPTSVFVRASFYNFEVWTNKDFIDQDIDIILDSHAPGTIDSPLGLDTTT